MTCLFPFGIEIKSEGVILHRRKNIIPYKEGSIPYRRGGVIQYRRLFWYLILVSNFMVFMVICETMEFISWFTFK
jgi:hypothetical protein